MTTAVFAITITACGGGDDDTAADGADAASTEADVATNEPAADEPAAEEPAAEEPAAEEPAAEEPAAEEPAAEEPASSGGTGAVLTLANGETFEFSVLCSLEPQMSAGSEILFTATSYDTPSLDITQFGDEGTITDIASISVYDASYDTLWEASTFYEVAGGSVELSLDGSTIRGTGSFFPGGDITAEPVEGEVVAEC